MKEAQQIYDELYDNLLYYVKAQKTPQTQYRKYLTNNHQRHFIIVTALMTTVNIILTS